MESINVTVAAELNLPPGMIDLGIGQPGMSLLPTEIIEKAANHCFARQDPSFLAYGAEKGDGHFRNALAGFLSEHYRMAVDPENLFATAGISQGLHFICSLFCRPGDTVFVEEPSYSLALRIFSDFGLRIRSVPQDEDGVMIEALEEELTKHKPKFFYLIPTFHNPTGSTLSEVRRQQLVQLSREQGFMIVADEVYHLLAYSVTPPPPLASFTDSETVLSLGSFSKILAPGLRLGWIQTHPNQMDRLLNNGLIYSGGGLNPFPGALVRSTIELGLQQEYLQRLRQIYSRRARTLAAALRRHLPAGITFVEPRGGFFIWLQLPEEVDCSQMFRKALEENIGYQPGAKCSQRQGLKNYLRLSFAFYEEAQLEEGARRLAKVIKNY